MNKKLWYDKKAEVWEEALPIGNGKIGAMVFSGSICDKIQITEETLWTGYPNIVIGEHSRGEVEEIRALIANKEYAKADAKATETMKKVQVQAFVSYGHLYVDMCWRKSEVSDYVRELDLETGVVRTSFRQEEMEIIKEYFVSLTDDILAMRLTAAKPIQRLHIYQAVELEGGSSYDIDTGIVTTLGKCPTAITSTGTILHEKDKESIQFCSRIKLISDGKMFYGGNSLWVENGTDVTILFSLKTSFNGHDKMPVSEGREYIEASLNAIEKASAYSFEELKQRHVAKYKSFFERVELKLDGEDYSYVPTDKRIQNAAEGNVDNGLAVLLFDYSRYLMICASQPGTQPMNLQGIWNDQLCPPWRSDYTLNINTEMNYWPTEICNLPECHMPLLEMLKDLSEKGNHFGLRGWSVWHNTDIWRFNHEASRTTEWGYWQMGGFWLARHIWEHYIHTRDLNFLREYYPVMVGAAKFLEDWMYEENGVLLTCPSTSPENQFFDGDQICAVCKGSAMDMAIIYDLYDKLIKMSDILGEDCRHYREILSKLAPVRIGVDGRILEWGEELPEWEKGHRHISHLYGFHPADVLFSEKYTEAVRKSLQCRLEHGGGHTGWSNAWIANVYARLGDGEGVMKHIRNMYAKSLYSNMFDVHPPFQIDGNFGIAAAICEALIQSHKGEIELLPALPDEWKSGEVRGFVTRTGEVIDFKWKDKKARIINRRKR